jgi:uncharacterized protein (UPF0332 family)
MNNETVLEVLKNLYCKTSKKMTASKELYNLGLFDDSASRSYSAVFHILSALLFTKGLTCSSHKEVIGNFNKEAIKTEYWKS